MIKTLIQRGLLALMIVGAAGASMAQTPPYNDSGSAGSFNLSDWTPDRYAPNNWTSNVTDPTGGKALRVHIDNSDRRNLRSSSYNAQFWDTQGRVRLNGFKATEVGGELYIPLSWGLQGNLRQAALWSRDQAQSESEAYYPIISFINNDPLDPYNPNAAPTPRFRVWDSTTGWIDKTSVPILWNAYNSFAIRDTGHSHQFFINGAMVDELSGDRYSLPENQGLKQIALEHTNFGLADNAADLPNSSYDVYWRNVYAIDPPTAATDSLTVDTDTSVPVANAILSNDTSPNDRDLFLYNWTQPAHGTLSIVGGQLKYSVTNYSGDDSFTYTITDDYGQTATGTVNLTVQQSKPSLLTLSPQVVTGGTGSTGTITMDHSVATGSYVVALSTDNPSVASVPSTMTISSGNTGTFPITTTQVLVDTTVQVAASYNGKTVRKNIVVKPLKLSSVKVTPATLIGGAQDGTLTLKLESAPTIYPVTIDLTGSDDAAADLDGVTSVTFGIGELTKTVAVDTHVVASNTTVTFSATLDGVTKQTSVVVKPVKIASLTVTKQILNPGQSGIATVTLTDALLPGESATVALSSAGMILTHDATLTITGGNSGTFTYSAPSTSLGFKAIIPLKAFLGVTKQINITVNK